MAGREIVVVGASAGGVEALVNLAAGLPADLQAAVFVVLHLPATSRSYLPEILNRAGPLAAAQAVEGEPIERGRLYVARPDYHLLVSDGKVAVRRGPQENRHRPAVDPLFRSAARAYGDRVIGVVLSGTMDDGTSGLLAIKRAGGTAIVQDPNEAAFPGMPQSALEAVAVDHVVRMAEMGRLVTRLVLEAPEPVGNGKTGRRLLKEDVEFASGERSVGENVEREGEPSTFTCPDCNGTLWEIHEDRLTRYRCRVGHAFSTDGLLAGQDEGVEGALWVALRSLEEQGSLARRLAERARGLGQDRAADRFETRFRETEQSAALLRGLLDRRLMEKVS